VEEEEGEGEPRFLVWFVLRLLVVDLDVQVGREDGAERAEVVVVEVDQRLVAFVHPLVRTQHIDDGLVTAGTVVPLVDAEPQRRLDLLEETMSQSM
jgi:hypothetical protein